MQQLIARNPALARALVAARRNLPDTRALARRLGPGLITGAADDDPSGIATYSQAGSQFRFGLVWTLLLTTPLMIGIQMLSARIGWVTGEGLAANIAKVCPRGLTVALVALLVAANTINIAADIGAMAEAARLLAGGRPMPYIVGIGALCVLGQLLFSYERSVRILKWLTLALFAYFAVVMVVKVPLAQATAESLQPWRFFPRDASLRDYASMVVAVLGTTISPYLFFWQAAQEVEDQRRRPGDEASLRAEPGYAQAHLLRIKQDTWVGMLFSNAIALCVVIATAVTLNLHGVTQIQTSAQAAEALRPLAGDFAFAVFALGIIGTGLLAVPVLAGSAAYAVSEVFGWKAGLSHGFHEARGFYAIIIAATGIGTLMSVFELDPIQALLWSAVVNGVISVPIMGVMMCIGQSRRLMGELTMSMRHRCFGWAATALMAAAVVVMAVTALPAFAAGGHHAVDDAAVLEPGQCQLEAWFDREQGGQRRLLHLGPACRAGTVELGLNFDRARIGGADAVTLAGAQAKWAVPVADGLSAGLVVAAALQDPAPRYAGSTLVLPVTWEPTATLRLHANLGRDFRPARPDSARRGLAAEWAALAQVSVVAERFRESGASFWRAGARWNVLPSLSIDLGRAAGLHHARPAWWTLGVNLLWDR